MGDFNPSGGVHPDVTEEFFDVRKSIPDILDSKKKNYVFDCLELTFLQVDNKQAVKFLKNNIYVVILLDTLSRIEFAQNYVNYECESLKKKLRSLDVCVDKFAEITCYCEDVKTVYRTIQANHECRRDNIVHCSISSYDELLYLLEINKKKV